ncbi:peptidyl-prolyl cis-trans isomerase SurA [Nonomuraea pusilla]|uniref:Peptidyl-prolyl cis-trans isomerase SurA n=1 Tax=Nonomuraea pusilla TaxID=46177 RepID=A0A1H7GHW0_9ACTN|nr:peptidyl-prolyl cis-trans isomerase SurA [Nonomuraea pusilla]
MAAAAVGIALTACSSPVGAGAAAVVGDERISTRDLTTNVEEYQAALKRANIEPEQLGVPVAQFVLYRMANESVFRQLGAKYKIQVSESEIDKALQDPGQYGSPEVNLLSKGVAPGNARGYLRAELGAVKVRNQFGGAQDQGAQDRFTKELSSIKPLYSPRYGQFTQQGFVDPGRFGKVAEQPPQQQQG